MENDLGRFSDVELVANAKSLADKEREIGIRVLKHLREIERRRLFAARGYGSLHEFCVSELKYSDGAAHRRISAMRLIKDVPQAEKAISEAKVTMTAAAMLQTFLKNERLGRKKVYSSEEKLTLLTELEGKSSRDCERHLAAISPQAMPRERERVLNEADLEVSFVANERMQKMMRRFKEVRAHALKTGSNAELLEQALEIALRTIDPMEKRKGERNPKESQHTAQTHAPAPVRASAQKLWNGPAGTYIPRSDYREVWQRCEGQCAFSDPLTKKRCMARHGLQIDHIRPRAQGGTNKPKNLRLLCRTHNQLQAIRHFGTVAMTRVIPDLRR